jgi:hypothetical protein
MDRWTDMMKLVGAFHDYADVPKKTGIRTPITSRNSTAILAHQLNSHGYCAYW